MANRLAREKSPYLLQHAGNPVDWYPWGEDAFEKARRENKPVFLSVGYSTCHWCHVMERESFEDAEVAALINEHYVPVKVDREERPDVDHIYMTVCQAMTGSGGWPLTVIMTPDKKPFFAGTYFPKHSKFGRPGLMDVLSQVHRQWAERQEEIRALSDRITAAVRPQFEAGGGAAPLGEGVLYKAYRSLKGGFDATYGGFGRAPKFPTPHTLGFLLRYWKWTGEQEALAMVEKTLQAMHDGGIYDHLGFGFARYSVDRRWLVPHFEKMLYDNALLAMAYLEAFQATGRGRYARVAREIFEYVLRDMTSPDGAFYSAEDADSEGEEGRFYVWTPAEIKEVLGPETGALFCHWYGVTEEGNFEGKNILSRVDAREQVEPAASPAEWDPMLDQARQKLFAAREKRVHPYKDDKVLTAWNSLMAAALAQGARTLQDDRCLDAAVRAVEFIRAKLRDGRGRLLARYRNGEAAYPAYLDDYAFLVWALIELYQADQKPRWLELALAVQQEQDRLFWDEDQGGYFFYGTDAEELLARPKEVYDGATPSGNSVAAFNLLRLARLTGRAEPADRAETVFRSFAGNVAASPSAHTHLLMALLFAIAPGSEVVVVADRGREQIREDLTLLGRTFAPESVFLYRFPGAEYERLAAVAPFVRDMTAREDKPTYYICRDFACRQPTTDLGEVREVLASRAT